MMEETVLVRRDEARAFMNLRSAAISGTVLDDGRKRVWAEMTDAELEDRLFTYLWLALHTPNVHTATACRLVAA
jgi:hypothetical protein